VLDGEIEAVHLAILYLAEEHEFDAVIHMSFDPFTAGKNAYRSAWIMVKK
jgi:hypothetical protein